MLAFIFGWTVNTTNICKRVVCFDAGLDAGARARERIPIPGADWYVIHFSLFRRVSCMSLCADSFEFYRILIIDCAEYWWMGIVSFFLSLSLFLVSLPFWICVCLCASLFFSIPSFYVCARSVIHFCFFILSHSAYLSVLAPWNCMPHTYRALECLYDHINKTVFLLAKKDCEKDKWKRKADVERD